MTTLDWVVLFGTIVTIAAYGTWATRHRSASAFLKGEALRWPTIGLSIMATQASAITFLSVPGQAYEDGMRFIQLYFGLPLASVLVAAFFVPAFQRANVFTAYEYLETRFDVRVRVWTALLFLIGRGLAAGITIYAPAILLSSVLGLPLSTLNAILGGFVIVYTVTGGASAVAQTQKQQMAVVLAGIGVAAGVIAARLPAEVGIEDAARLAGALGRMNAVDFQFDWESRYTFWSGITGGLFLQLSYFGTDQSQVQRYLGGATATESRLGLLFNGILKIPMQFFILFIGILLFVFYIFERPPIFFDETALERVRQTEHRVALEALEAEWDDAFAERRAHAEALVVSDDPADRAALSAADARMTELRKDAKELVATALPGHEGTDSDYIFVSFVLDRLPSGVVGFLLAVIFLASMSSTASELSALGATTTLDLYKRLVEPAADDRRVLRVGQVMTVAWGLFALLFATYASLLDNLIQAVNILGSIFYGVILGTFLVGFMLRWVGASATLIAAVIAELTVVTLFFFSDVSFLWFNAIGCALTMALAVVAQAVLGGRPWGGTK